MFSDNKKKSNKLKGQKMKIRRNEKSKSKPDNRTITESKKKKKGNYSFYRVTLEDLNKCLKPDATVIVAQKFAKTQNIPGFLVGANFEETVTV